MIQMGVLIMIQAVFWSIIGGFFFSAILSVVGEIMTARAAERLQDSNSRFSSDAPGVGIGN